MSNIGIVYFSFHPSVTERWQAISAKVFRSGRWGTTRAKKGWGEGSLPNFLWV